MSLQRDLKALNACRDAVKWAADYETLGEAWAACERPDWMLWLCGKMQGTEGWPNRKQIVSVACDIAESVLPIYEKKYPDDKRVRNCIEVTRKWFAGEATIEEVQEARRNAYTAADTAYTAATAATADTAYTAAAAAYAAAYTAATAATADTAYTAADTAYAAAAYAAAADAAYAKQKEICSLIREKLQIPAEVTAERKIQP